MEKRKNAGFTLIELIVTIALLGLAMGPLMGTFMSSIQTNRLSRAKLKATYLAEYMEEGFHQFVFEEYEKKVKDATTAKTSMAPLFPSGATIGDIEVIISDGAINQLVKKVEYSDNKFTVLINIKDERTDRATNSSKYFVYTIEVNVYTYTNGQTSGKLLATMKGSMINIR